MEEELVAGRVGSAPFGKYQLFATLGRGGMADVFLAALRGPMGFNKLTVIKRLRDDLAADPVLLTMLLDEARLAARLSHPNVVHTYEVGATNGQYFMAMEYLEGQPLNAIVHRAEKRGHGLEPAVCARIVADALAGLHYAHELKDYDGTPLRIIHRDVSPHNVFVTYDGPVKLMDFGIAKAALRLTSTEAGVVKGKLAYMSPEQAMGTGELDRRADIFAMGIVLWELLARKRLFSSVSAAATVHKLMTQPMPRVSSVVKGTAPALDAIVARALEKDRDARYQTALEMRADLEDYLATHDASSEDVGQRVSELFDDTRKSVTKRVQAFMSQPAGEPVQMSTGELAALNLDSLKRLESGASDTPADALPMFGDAARAPGGDSVVGPIESERVALHDAHDQKRKWIAIAIACLLAAGASMVLVATTSVPVTPPAPSAASQAPPGPSLSSVTIAPPVKEEPAPIASAPPPSVPTPRAPMRAAVPVSASPFASAPASASAPAPAPAPASAGTGYLTFDTYPWTRVSEDGRPLGVTPLVRVPLSAGTHVLLLENPEQSIRQPYTLTVRPGESISRRLGLE